MFIYYLIGSLTGCFVSSLFFNYKIRKLKNGANYIDGKYLRRGIYKPDVYDYKDLNKPVRINVECEVGELERTDKKSKIEVIEYKIITPGYAKSFRIVEISEGWFNTGDIKWFENKKHKRNNKIDDLLDD